MSVSGKFTSLILVTIMLIISNGCANNSNNDSSGNSNTTVSEPYSIRMFAEKKHSGEVAEKRVFEANTKSEFDSLINKYKIQYDTKECLYQFDKGFFKNNKVYVIHVNYYNYGKITKYNIKNENNLINMKFYISSPKYQTDEVKKGYYGEIVAVSKDFAKDVEKVNVEYIDYNND